MLINNDMGIASYEDLIGIDNHSETIALRRYRAKHITLYKSSFFHLF
jgi:hypothetical protein